MFKGEKHFLGFSSKSKQTWIENFHINLCIEEEKEQSRRKDDCCENNEKSILILHSNGIIGSKNGSLIYEITSPVLLCMLSGVLFVCFGVAATTTIAVVAFDAQ